ncbi:OpgC domain-containing protein [Bradyrhizobium sp. 2TAF24]|uniref:OpgC domain-containing protein n=1 Tax=Bradyrhizobium sp. 2TAF24 TaxID=3233011 RepID=UPI003F906250
MIMRDPTAAASPPKDPLPAMRPLGRDLQLDACRGIALWFIFLDHIPNNIGSWFTLRNYGFSDATEVFMFVSGVTCAVAYGRTRRRQGWRGVVAHTLRRGWDIYAGFLLLILACAIVVFTAGGGRLADDSNTRILFEQPGPTLLHAALLQYRPVNTDVLPTFVLFHLLFAPLLLALQRAPNMTLATSFGLYVLVQHFGWNIPAWPANGWYFNPLAWQLLFVLGAWWALRGRKRLRKQIASRTALWLAAGYLAFSLVVVMSWTLTPLTALVPDALARAIYPIDKPDLDPLRLLHFLALAMVAASIVPRRRDGLLTPPLVAAIRCGENSLPIYCLGVLLALAGHIVLTRLSGALAMQAAVSIAGILLMILAANAITAAARLNRQRRGLF